MVGMPGFEPGASRSQNQLPPVAGRSPASLGGPFTCGNNSPASPDVAQRLCAMAPTLAPRSWHRRPEISHQAQAWMVGFDPHSVTKLGDPSQARVSQRVSRVRVRAAASDDSRKVIISLVKVPTAVPRLSADASEDSREVLISAVRVYRDLELTLHLHLMLGAAATGTLMTSR
jgi:hypothetical protein